MPEPAPEGELQLPPVPPPRPQPPAAGPSFALEGLAFEGNSAFTDAELRAVADPLLPARVTITDLEAARRALTRHYIEAGYVSSGVILPEQRIAEGVVRFRVIEGRLSEVRVTGDRIGPDAGPFGDLDPDYVRDRLRVDGDRPFNVADVEERFRVLLDDPMIDRLRGSVRPGDRLGETILDVATDVRRPLDIRSYANNHNPVSTGSETFGIDAALWNSTGWGDRLSGRLEVTPGRRDLLASFEVPVTAGGLTPYVQGEYATSEVVTDPFRVVDIESAYRSLTFGARQPLLRTSRQRLTLDLSFGVQESETFLLGQPFSFSPGVDDGESRISVLRFAQEYVDRSPEQVLALRSSFSLGVDVLDATARSDDTLPDGQYLSWLGQAQAARRLVGRTSVIGGLRAHLANDSLLPLAQVAIGGFDTVRGYRENALVDDNALLASIEGRVPLLDLRLPDLTPADHDSRLYLAPFVDAGTSWSHADGFGGRTTILGAGIGLRWAPAPNLDLTVYYGEALSDLETPPGEDDLQDVAIYIQFGLRAP
jgi:hemolysin activation/secretion protein